MFILFVSDRGFQHGGLNVLECRGHEKNFIQCTYPRATNNLTEFVVGYVNFSLIGGKHENIKKIYRRYFSFCVSCF
jgi:hypothetical protein